MVTVAGTLAQSKWNHLGRAHKTGKAANLDNVAIFDAASRGVMGSLHVLLKFKGVHIACAGGALTIATMGLGLFSQQLISIRIDEIEVAAPGNVPRAVEVTANGTLPLEGGDSQGLEGLSLTAQLAFHLAILSPRIENLTISCPSTNCRWPIIPTIGVCGACRNATADVEIDRTTTEPVFCGVDFSVAKPFRPSYRPCPDEADANFTVNYFATRAGGAQDNSLPKFPLPGSAEESARTLWLGQILAIGSDSVLNTREPIEVFKLPAVRAYHCGLWYCIQARNISVDRGVVSDTVSETWNDVVGASASGLPPSFNGDSSETFFVKESSGIPHMSSKLTSRFRNGVPSFPSFATPGLSLPLYGLIIHKHFHHMDDLIDKIARSFTNDVRTSPTQSEEPSPARQYNPRYNGTMISTQVTLVIRWQWLAFPASMVLLTTIYLVLKISRTRGIRDVRPWKEDALIPLLIELDQDLGDRARAGIETPGGVRKRIGEVPVKY